MTELEYNAVEVVSFLRDLQEEKFAQCERWDESDCNCCHCRIEHYAKLAEKVVTELTNTRFVMDRRGDEVELLRAALQRDISV